MQQKELITIAIAYSQTTFRKGIEAYLQFAKNCPIKIAISAANGSELIDALVSAPRLPDVVVLDINMPVMNGYSAVKVIRQRWPDQKILILVEHKNNYALGRVISYGANGFLSKGASIGELFDTITQIYRDQWHCPEHLIPLWSLGQQELDTLYPELTEMEMAYLVALCELYENTLIANRMKITQAKAEELERVLCRKLEYKEPHMLAVFAVQTGLLNNVDVGV